MKLISPDVDLKEFNWKWKAGKPRRPYTDGRWDIGT